MIVAKDIETVRKTVRQYHEKNESIAIVTTMGNLHTGHITLVKEAEKLARHTVATVFVNPLQFNNKNDLKTYPRTPDADLKKLEDAGVLKLLKICVRGPGVGLQVVLVVELQRVDENGRNGMPGELLRLLYEGDVPGVEIAHGCNNGNRLVLLMILTHGLSYRLNILCYYHNCSARLLAGVSSEKGPLPL